jgi:hypothetical protein
MDVRGGMNLKAASWPPQSKTQALMHDDCKSIMGVF